MRISALVFVGAISLVSVAVDGAARKPQKREVRVKKAGGKKDEIAPPIFPNDSLVFEGVEPRVRREWRTLSLVERLKVAT